MPDNKETRLQLRVIAPEDYPQLAALMDTVYPDIGGAWPKATIQALMNAFPDGQICIVDNEKLVAAALTIKVSYNDFSSPHKYKDIVSDKHIARHNDAGDALYGLDVFAHPDYRGFRLGRRLYEARKELCRVLNLKAILAGGRIIGYNEYAEQFSVSEYIDRVKRKEIYDPILSFQLSNDFDVKRLMRSYLPEDKKSAGYATLLEWDNIFFDEEVDSVHDIEKTIVRIGVVQWQMRAVESVDELLKQAEFFVESLSDYKSDFALFPEFFNAPIMGLSENQSSVDAIRFLSEYTDRIKNYFSHLAVTNNINIIAGSMPLLEGNRLYNVAYLLHRDGRIDEQYKIHITPHEKRDWVIDGGDILKVFSTDAGKVGILICYDVEFPELARLLAKEDVQILFVPFWTDTKNGYLRVRLCAQARAIENECYVAISGSVGNLPKVDNVDIQYAQSAVFSPSDVYFPHDAIIAEATPNAEMMLFADVDLEKLKILSNEGSVNNLKDRRLDLYSISTRKKR
ncbi:MAG: carbon-nitrogen hydrolase family protein [Pseudomonadales bacterium]|nr:carbon-nitrogen hydrolase family protein [Pseudomonadales bacterium]